jgi:hypothetical protein
MSIIDQIKSLFRSEQGGSAGLHFAVKCSRCGEVIRVRADRRFDLEQDFDPGGSDTVQGYVLRKEVLGNRCQQLLRLTVHYNSAYHEVERELEGGEFVDEAT